MSTSHPKNLHRSYNSNSDLELKNTDEYNKRLAIMNELLISNPELLNNFCKRNSKTPCRLRMKNPFNFTPKIHLHGLNSRQLSPKETTNLKIKKYMNHNKNINYNLNNIKKNRTKPNFRDMNTSPLMRHVCIQEDSRNINTNKKKKEQ